MQFNTKNSENENKSVENGAARPQALDIDRFAQRVTAMQERVFHLLDLKSSEFAEVDFVPSASKELGLAVEELQVAIEELQHQNQALAIAAASNGTERDYYRELFESAPIAYLLTDLNGTIQESNRAAAKLLNVPARFLPGKPLSIFVSETYRQYFRVEMTRQQQLLVAAVEDAESSSASRSQALELCLQPRDREAFDAICRVTLLRNAANKPTALAWLLKAVTKPKTMVTPEHTQPIWHQLDIPALVSNYPIHSYNRDELTLLDNQNIWLVTDGLVKLTTLTEYNEEVLIGLVGPGMPLGTCLTPFALYEATAFSSVQMVAISLDELSHSPHLAQNLFLAACRRLQQTEKFIVATRQRRVSDRLYQMFQLLSVEIGQVTPQGIRLPIPLTHEDLAALCGSDRLSISRLLKRLQQQGQISIEQGYYVVCQSSKPQES